MTASRQRIALRGGPKTREKPFPPHPIIGAEEKRAVLEVLDSGSLSAFIASPGQLFLGGAKVREFEEQFANAHGVAYAVAFDSATAALHAAVVAVGVEPGEEVIVPPYTFTSTATSVLMHNAIPVFADIEEDIFCLDPVAVERAITARTRAVIPVHLFGHPASLNELLEVARRHGLRVIEDCAQAPGALYDGRPVGTFGDCGIFSFTESKTMTTGEGGMLITNDEGIATVARMVRNHGEVMLDNQELRTYTTTILGWNYRMTEIAAALGIVQFRRLREFNECRIELAAHLTERLSSLPGIAPPVLRPGCEHVFYVYPILYDEAATGISRARFAEALIAEGIPIGVGYIKPLYWSSIYHDNRPAAYRLYEGAASYERGICPVTERLYEQELLLLGVVRPPAVARDMDDIADAIEKVLAAGEQLRGEEVEAR